MMFRRLLWAGFAGLALSIIISAATPYAQLLNAARLSVSVRQGESVFDNSGSPWAFSATVPSVAYDNGGSGVAYVATPHPNCPTNGSAYRPDYINFNPDTGQTPAFRIGCFVAGELYRTTTNISIPGPFVVNLVVANGGGSAATVSVLIDGVTPPAATINVPQTANYSTFVTAQSGQFNATQGNHVLTLSCTTGDTSNNACGDMRSWQGATASSSSVPAPAPAQNAGLTTLARNWDFSQPQYANQANWLDCNNNNDNLEWHRGSPGLTNSSVPCDIHQVADPNTGDTVMAWQYLRSYNVGGGNDNFVSAQTINTNGGGGFVGFPNGGSYIEIRVREDGTYNGFNNSSGPDALFMGGTDPTSNAQLFGNGGGNSGSGGCWYEVDVGELWQDAGGFANGNAHLYPCSQATIWKSFDSENNLPSGWAVTNYHTYGALLTGNGSGSAFVCMYVDNILQQSCRQMVQGMSIDSSIQFYPERLIVWAGSYDPNNVQRDKKMYVQFIRVWSCPDWASQMTDHSTAHCKGSTLTNNGALQFWHN